MNSDPRNAQGRPQQPNGQKPSVADRLFNAADSAADLYNRGRGVANRAGLGGGQFDPASVTGGDVIRLFRDMADPAALMKLSPNAANRLRGKEANYTGAVKRAVGASPSSTAAFAGAWRIVLQSPESIDAWVSKMVKAGKAKPAQLDGNDVLDLWAALCPSTTAGDRLAALQHAAPNSVAAPSNASTAPGAFSPMGRGQTFDMGVFVDDAAKGRHRVAHKIQLVCARLRVTFAQLRELSQLLPEIAQLDDEAAAAVEDYLSQPVVR